MKRQSNSLTPKRKGMAQEKTPNEKPKRTRKPKAGSDALPVEQITELMLVHNKNDPKFGVQAVSEIDKDGKAKTVPADEKNENSFLKFDKNSSILENFIKNFWSQLKEPTHFRLLRMTYHDYKVNKQAIRDLSEGKQTDAVKEFLKRYEIRPRENKKEQSVNQKEKTAMADKETQPQEPLQQSEVQQAAQSLAGEVDAIFVPNDSVIQSAMPMVTEVARDAKIPVYGSSAVMVDSGAFATIAISDTEIGAQTADMALEYLNGTAMEDIAAVVVPASNMVINQDTADALEITFSDEVQNEATFVKDAE